MSFIPFEVSSPTLTIYAAKESGFVFSDIFYIEVGAPIFSQCYRFGDNIYRLFLFTIMINLRNVLSYIYILFLIL